MCHNAWKTKNLLNVVGCVNQRVITMHHKIVPTAVWKRASVRKDTSGVLWMVLAYHKIVAVKVNVVFSFAFDTVNLNFRNL
jgi:hypothetical protein